MNTMTEQLNGVNADAVVKLIEDIRNDGNEARAGFGVTTTWKGGVRSETQVRQWNLGGRAIEKRFALAIDEPLELGGTNSAPNPQEVLLAGFNACVLATYVAVCTLKGIEVEEVRVESEGELDLRGFLGLDESTPAGYTDLTYRVRLKAGAPDDALREVHEVVKKQSPNYFNMARSIRLHDELMLA